MKGTSAVIAAVLLLMITVSLAAAAYVWFNSTFSATTQLGTKQIERSSQVFGTEFKIESVSADSIYVRNTGTADISNITVFVGNILANTTSPVIKPGEMAKITINSFVDYNASKTIKVTSGVGVGTVASIGPSQNYDTLVGYWKFDEGSGTVAFDVSGNKRDGTITGTTWTTGVSSNALQFNGGSDQVRTDNLAANTLAGAKNTVEFWMYWTGTNVIMPIGWNGAHDIAFSGSCMGFNTGNGDNLGIPSAGLANRWVHVVAVFYNGVPSSINNELWIDGTKQALSQCVSSPLSQSATSTFFVSGWGAGPGYKFVGKIDQVRIWNRTLSANEIAAHYLTEKP